ncbi:MAG: BTAD domain-containing putative transcriptional regulator [Caldilineaceae bacterium]
MHSYPLRFFGPGLVLGAAGQPLPLRSRKQLALLAYLATEHTIAHSRETLMALFWPNESTESARNNLRVTLSRLREVTTKLGPTPKAELLVIDRNNVQLHAAWLERCDSNHFQRLLAETRQHSHTSRDQCAACQSNLLAAGTLYQADFMAGFGLEDCPEFEEWLLVQREKFHVFALEAYADLANYAENKGDLAAARLFAQRQIEIDPLRESPYRQLMRILAKAGERTAALAIFERCRTLLRQELGLDPEAETLSLHLQLLNAEGSGQGSAADPSIDSSNSAGSIVATPYTNLRHPLTTFIGRAEELEQLQSRLATRTYRLLSIVGPGGIGKTRLAMQVAAQALNQFADGVFFVSLAKVERAESIPTAIVEGLQLSLAVSSKSPKEQLLNMIGNRHLLLVLDNFEHLMDGSELLVELLQHAQNLTVMITSRQRLNLHVEDLFELQGLSTPQRSDDREASQYPAVQLFLDRANRIAKQLKFGAEQLSAVVQICQRVEGFPLAIELAAAWLREMNCQEIVAELGAGLQRLATTLQDVAPEHRSLRAVFDTSWRLLSRQEQKTLTQLVIFRGSFSAEAAGAVAEASPAILSELRNKSLLRYVSSQRYDMHALVHQFSAEVLASEPATIQAVRRHHAHYFMNLLATQAVALDTRQAGVVATKLQPDWENIVLAWQWSSEQPELGDLHAALDGLVRFGNLRSLFQETQMLLEQSIRRLEGLQTSLADDPQRQLLLCRLSTQRAYFAGQRGLANTQQLAQHALALAKQIGSHSEIISNYLIQASAFEVAADFEQARQLAEQALAMAQADGFELQQGDCFDLLGIIALEVGQFDRASDLFHRVLAIHERTGRLEQRSRTAIGLLGSIATEQERYDVALNYKQRYLESCQEMDDPRNTAHALQGLSFLWSRLGAYEKSLETATQSVALTSIIGDREIKSLALHTKAWAYRHLGQLSESLECASQAVALARDVHATLALAYALGQLAETQLATADVASWGEVEANFQEARVIFRSLGKTIMTFEVELGLAELFYRRGNNTEAFAQIVPILPHLPIDAAESWDESIRAYVICTRILQTSDPLAAETLLAQGMHLLKSLAKKISDRNLRNTFLHANPWHRQLYALQAEWLQGASGR